VNICGSRLSSIFHYRGKLETLTVCAFLACAIALATKDRHEFSSGDLPLHDC
jgi:hypothetical protein